MKFKKIIFFALLLSACSSKKDYQSGPSHSDQQVLPSDDGNVQRQHPQGTITSSGGYIYGYKANPWFIGNVQKVHYCIDMDEEHFGPSQIEAEASIERAIGLWQSTLRSAPYKLHKESPVGTLVLGTQEFVKTDCFKGQIDIRFQLGKLTSDQQYQLGNPRKYVSSAVQTSYDEENMRGEGFIYIAPEKGDLRPEAIDLADDFWRYDDRVALDMVLLHELGHVFGFQHSQYSLFPMSPTMCEEIVTKNFQKSMGSMTEYISTADLVKMLMDRMIHVDKPKILVALEDWKKFLSLQIDDPNANGADLVMTGKEIELWSVKIDLEKPPYSRTRLKKLTQFEKRDEYFSHDTLVAIRVPPSQKVFTFDDQTKADSQGTAYSTLELVQKQNRRMDGYMVNPENKKQLWIEAQSITSLDPEFIGIDLEVQCVVDGEIVRLNQ